MGRLCAITLDETSIGHSNANAEHERAVAIYDIIEDNNFAPLDCAGRGPFSLRLALVENRLHFALTDAEGESLPPLQVPMNAFRKVLKDYFLTCDSYYAAVRTASAQHIEAIDHERRALHDDGAKILLQRLEGKVTLDHNTARRLFTLISALHWKG